MSPSQKTTVGNTSNYNEMPPTSTLSDASTKTTAIVPVQQPLSPQEIERMCKAFIRLITAEDTRKADTEHGTGNKTTNIPTQKTHLPC